MVVEQPCKQEAVHRGNLVIISEFLRSFAFEYDVENGPITPDDIDDALEFANRDAKHRLLEEVYYHWKRDWHDDEDLVVAIQQQRWNKILNESKIARDSVSDRAKQTHTVLQRFEVWSIKAIAQKNLLPTSTPVENNTSTLHSACWSSLLNIPGACHFAKILPNVPVSSGASDDEGVTNDIGQISATGDAKQPDDDENSNRHAHDGPCFLALPPNTLTSREYLRLARMMSLLPDDHSRWQAANSPLTWVQKEGVGLGDFRFSAPDLVALWIRAQRNTCALRHLWQIFSVSEQVQRRSLTIRGSSGSGKRLVPVQSEDQDEEEKLPRRFVAKMIGNSRKTRARIVNESSYVDELVTWAVINEVMCTFHHLRDMIKTRLILRKRRLSGLYHNSRKRRRVEQTDQQEDCLRNACQSYVLRWFARRHIDTLAVLFFSNPASLARSDSLIGKMCDAGVPLEIHSKVADDSNSFVQIDRNIGRGKYRTFERFYEVVNNLLEAMSSSITPELLAPETMRDIIADFDEMYETFLKERNPAGSAGLLLDLSALSPEQSLAELLRSLPAPWADRCRTCSESIRNSDAVVCSCCGESYHSGCCEKRDVDRCQAFDLIRRLWTLSVPRSLLPGPDFRGKEKWTTLNITVVREAGNDGTLPRLGLSLINTEECVEFYDLLVSGNADVSKLDEKRHINPIRVEQKGCIVTEVHSVAKGCGKAAGIQRGDVIVGLEFRSFLDPSVEAKYLPRRLHSFAKLSNSERMDMFRRPATEMRILIERPDFDILQQSNEFLQVVRQVNDPIVRAMAVAKSKTWLCGKCVARQAGERGSLPVVLRDAILARSLLRCLGADYYAVPLHDEESRQEQYNCIIPDSMHVSLRRLDGMMTSIIARQSNAQRCDDAMLSVPFNRPPWSKSETGDRLDWAPEELESKPLELLCRGVKLLVSTSAEVVDEGLLEKSMLLARNFVVLFSSWYPSSPADNLVESPDPPQGAFCARVPWLRDCCDFCQVRSGEIAPEAGDDIAFRVCGSQACRAQLVDELSHNDTGDSRSTKFKNSKFPIASTDLALFEYEESSSFIGATVLILPGDPVLRSVQERLGFNIEHSGRVVEFIVASYLPGFTWKNHNAGDRTGTGSEVEGEGTFHLLPVLSQHQLQFLLQRCKLRKASSEQGGMDIEWLSLDVLELNGVLRLSPADLRRRLVETKSINAALDRALEMAALVGIDNSLVNRDNVEVNQVGDSAGSHFLGLTSPSYAFLQGSEAHKSSEFQAMESISRCIQQSVEAKVTICEKQKQSSFLSEITEMLIPLLGRCGRDEDFAWHMSDSLDYSSESVQILPETQIATQKDESSVPPCIVKYSDLYFRSHEEKRRMRDALRGQQPKEPHPSSITFRSLSTADSALFTVVLDREDSSKANVEGKYTGPGWGLELLVWPRVDSNVRVGRVHPISPAAVAGLAMHDVVMSINGYDVRGRHDFVAWAMINFIEGQKKALTVTELSNLFKNPRNSPITPVVLVVCRPTMHQQPLAGAQRNRVSTDTEKVPRLIEPISRNSSFHLLSPHNLAQQTLRSSLLKAASPHASAITVAKNALTAEPAFGNLATSRNSQSAAPQAHARFSNPLLHCTSGRSEGTLGEGKKNFSHPDSLPLAFRVDARGVSTLPAQPRQRDCTESGLITVNAYRSGSSNATLIPMKQGAGSGRYQVNHSIRASSLDSVDVANRSITHPTNTIYTADSSTLQSGRAIVAVTEAWNACAALLLRIYETVRDSYQLSRVLSFRDIYRPTIPNIIFTNPEASLLLESARRRIPMVGLGLLSLRYDVKMINWQLSQLIRRDLSSIPRFPHGLWDFLLLKDKKRKQDSESILPIDRLSESFLKQQEESTSSGYDGYSTESTSRLGQGLIVEPTFPGHVAENSNLDDGLKGHNHREIYQHPSGQHVWPNSENPGQFPSAINKETFQTDSAFGRPVELPDACNAENAIDTNEIDLERIRGGGEGQDQTSEGDHRIRESRLLSECPYAEWPNKLVTGMCDLLTDDTTNQAAKFIGLVMERYPAETEGSADSVRISVFHLTYDDVSSFIEDEEQVVSSSMLHLVEVGSDEEEIARTWWDMRLGGNIDHRLTGDFDQKSTDGDHHPDDYTSAPDTQILESSLPVSEPAGNLVNLELRANTADYNHEVCTNELKERTDSLATASPPTPELKESQNLNTDMEQSAATATQGASQSALPPSPSDVNLGDPSFKMTRSDAETTIQEPEEDESAIGEHQSGLSQGESQESLIDNNESLSTQAFRELDTSNMDGSLSHEKDRPESFQLVRNGSTMASDDPFGTFSSLPLRGPENISTQGHDEKRSSRIVKEQAEIDVEAAGRSLRDYLTTSSYGSLSPLGELPDGREVFWLPGDPGQVYLRNYEGASKEFLLRLNENSFRRDFSEDVGTNGNGLQATLPESGKLCCLWGCLVNEPDTHDNNPFLCFDTIVDLEAHITQCHPVTDAAKKVSFDIEECLLRISERGALRLLVDLTDAICSRFPSMRLFTQTQEPTGRHNRDSTTLFRLSSIWEHSNGFGGLTRQVENILKGLHNTGKRLRAFMLLWVRIFLLFETGHCDSDEHHSSHEALSETRSVACDTVLLASRARTHGLICKTCNVPSDRFKSWNVYPVTGQKSYQGAGCALVSDLYHSENKVSPIACHRERAGLLGVAQHMLLRAAHNLPEAVKNVEADSATVRQFSDKQSLIFPLWSGTNFDIWRDFVSGCTGSRSLAQGLLVLVASIERSLLPDWWSNPGKGWLSAQSLMFKPTLANVLLHLIAFDTAVAEFVLTAGTSPQNNDEKDNVPASLATIPLEQRMTLVAKWADELNVPRFEGAYTNFCCKCDDGGDLLCCEYCSSVQHPGCCSPPLPNDPPVFVCSVCIADIAALHEPVA